MNRASIDYMHEHKSMWAITSKCNEFVRNVMPIGRNDSIPYTTLTKRKFDHRALRVPLSACFSMVENKHLNSHDDKREQKVLAGYDYKSPSYLLYDRLTRRVFRERTKRYDSMNVDLTVYIA